ncbi:MAG: hypothetical protein LH481_02975 [Burkholderiales bacterium]|nr:hypothetical protein [Burkholderiales bacterium]
MFVRPPTTQVSQDDKYIAYRTPARSDFWWGAYLVSRDVVTKDSLPGVLLEWEKRLGDLKDIKKKIIQWELPLGDLPVAAPDLTSEFNDPAAEAHVNSVLVATPVTIQSAFAMPDVTLHEAKSAADFAAIVDMAIADLECTPELPATADFLRWKHGQFHEGVKQGGGKWWMLKFKGEFVANCGLFTHKRIARFREVTTHPQWRCRGFARILCQLVLAEGFKDPTVDQAVVISEHNSSPERIYKSVGFSPTSFQVALQWDLK